MKKTALLLALMSLAGAAMAEGGCHAEANHCQPEVSIVHTAQNDQAAPADALAFPPTQASAPAVDASAPAIDASAPAIDASAPGFDSLDGAVKMEPGQQPVHNHSNR